MNALVIYDSVYGNTQQIARAIGAAISGGARVARPGEAAPADLTGTDLLVVGSPTHGGRQSPAVLDFVQGIPGETLKHMNAAAFDTRVSTKWVGVFGYAAGRIARTLEHKGASLVAQPEGFFVAGTKGPLKDGELERAAAWARQLGEIVSQNSHRAGTP
jgi:flavodoxin